MVRGGADCHLHLPVVIVRQFFQSGDVERAMFASVGNLSRGSSRLDQQAENRGVFLSRRPMHGFSSLPCSVRISWTLATAARAFRHHVRPIQCPQPSAGHNSRSGKGKRPRAPLAQLDRASVYGGDQKNQRLHILRFDSELRQSILNPARFKPEGASVLATQDSQFPSLGRCIGTAVHVMVAE